jgi:hypothetical protein
MEGKTGLKIFVHRCLRDPAGQQLAPSRRFGIEHEYVISKQRVAHSSQDKSYLKYWE